MTLTLAPAVGLLERAVGFTRGALAGVTPVTLTNPTPCRDWDLSRLLLHMDDALAAFTEASAGTVALEATPVDGDVLGRIRQRACTLLGAWAGLGQDDADPPGRVVVGGVGVPTDLLVSAGALEITVHGWDVGQATGHPAGVPEDLARRLLPVAATLVTPEDRPQRFAAVVTTAPDASYADRLLALVGRAA